MAATQSTPTWVIALIAVIVALVAVPIVAGLAVVALGVVAGAGFYTANQQAVHQSRRAVVEMELIQLHQALQIAQIEGTASACGSEADARAALSRDGGLKAIPGADAWDGCLNTLGATLDPSYGRYWIQADADGLAVHAVVDLEGDGAATHLATGPGGDVQVLDGAW